MVANNKFVVIGVAAAVLALVVLVKKKGAATAVGSAIGGAAVDLAGGFTSGVAYGIGDAVGLPRTSVSECQQLLNEGRLWEASFKCPAGTFIGGAASAASDGFGNAVQSVGEVIGVPRTNMTECERAKAEGRTLDASFACPAGDFLSYLFK